MKQISTTRTTARIKREIEALKKLPDSEIDTSEIRILPPEAWANAVVGKFYRPIKKSIALRLDADVIAWAKSTGKGYQSRINEILRREMISALKSSDR
jgi:uncharacterized protein (DUF4415 family)